MKLFDTIPYTYEKNDYKIRIYYDDATINVAAFLFGYPVNGYRFQVKIPKKCDARKILEIFPVPDLVEMCKKKIQEKNWESLSKIIHDNLSA